MFLSGFPGQQGFDGPRGLPGLDGPAGLIGNSYKLYIFNLCKLNV